LVPKPTQKSAPAKNAGPPKQLTSKERQVLRALGHPLSPVVQIGKAGLTGGVTQELNNALDAHELIKVQVLGECPLERPEAAEKIAAVTKATVVQALGRILLFYRPNPDKRQILLTPSEAQTQTKSQAEPPKRTARSRPATRNARRPAGRTARRQSASRGNKK
jgi:RNA-binding protein